LTKNPEYTNNNRGRPIATKCRVCGGSLITPQDIKLEAHEECLKQYKSNNYIM